MATVHYIGRSRHCGYTYGIPAAALENHGYVVDSIGITGSFVARAVRLQQAGVCYFNAEEAGVLALLGIKYKAG